MYLKKLKVVNIMNSITSCTEMNFQNRMVILLDILCDCKKIKFEKVQPSNGDGKNDGWIVDRNVYFAMYSPNDAKVSQNSQIISKLESDLRGLCDQVFNKNRWGKDIAAFYLIVNTHDKDLPADPDRLRERKIEEIKEEFKKEFDAEVISVKDIKKYLIDQEDDIIDKIIKNLDIDGITSDFSMIDVIKFVDEYTQYLALNNISKQLSDFSRISIDNKIEINKLTNLKEHIYSLIEAADKIDSYVSYIVLEDSNMEKYENVKNYIIREYKILSKDYSGEELYNKLIEKLKYDNMNYTHICILEAFVVDIFIKCDIFEKE